eukprot:c20_g1_i1.p1 GENE.c20_g1_i1~~c20_g1_i1.p1  ORF type:complete len:276 (+),score=48.19 c20_g1_i1:56-883(+)
MSVPPAPVLLKDAKCDRTGLLVSWMIPNNAKCDSHTLSWKAESWWQSSSATVPGLISEFLIQNLPANEKVTVWIFSTNEVGSSSWSAEVQYVTSRDCGMEGPPEPDVTSEVVPIPPQRMFDVFYTPELDEYFTKCGIQSNIELLSLEQRGNQIHKHVRVTPPIPEKLKDGFAYYLGENALTYEEHSIKNLDTNEITFEVTNIPVVGKYCEAASGSLQIKDMGNGSSQLLCFITIRINYPVIGYYVAQVIRASVCSGMQSLPRHILDFLQSQEAQN